MIHFNRKTYLILFLIFLFIEIYIALFIKQIFIRGFVGDVFVVLLMYYFLQSLFKGPPLKFAYIVLVIAFCVEILQYFKIIEVLSLSGNKIASTIIGTTFSFYDLIAYTVGFVLVLIIQSKYIRK